MSAEMAELLLLEFNEKNPDILVRLLNSETSVPVQYVESRQNRNSIHLPLPPPSPDIFIFNESDFRELVAAGLLADLSFYFSLIDSDIMESENDQFDDEPGIELSLITAMPFTSGFAVPLVSFMYMLYYNIDILSAAGFDHPPKTRDEFIRCVRAVSRGNFPGVMGAALSLNPDDRQAMTRDIFSWIWAAGGNFWSEENNLALTSTSYNTRAVANDITFFSNLNREVQPFGIFEKTGNQRIEEFANGQIALMIASTRFIPYLREQMGDSAFGITTIPTPGTGGRYNITLSSMYAGINSDSPHSDEAWRFLKFLVEKSAFFCEELSAIPGSITNLIPGDYVRNDPFYHKAWDIFEASQIIKSFSGIPDAQEYETAFLEEFQVFLDGGWTALQTVTAIERRWEEISRTLRD